jgi:primosomal protein N' (replication factor Y)
VATREQLGYPPAGRLVAFRMEGASERATRTTAQVLGRRARERIESAPWAGQVTVLGPAEAPLARLHGKVRYQMLLRGRRGDLVRRFARELLPGAARAEIPRGVRVAVDVDPVNLL